MLNLIRRLFAHNSTPARQPRYAIYLVANVEGREMCGRFLEYQISRHGVDYVRLYDFEYGCNLSERYIEASQVISTKWVKVS